MLDCLLLIAEAVDSETIISFCIFVSEQNKQN